MDELSETSTKRKYFKKNQPDLQNITKMKNTLEEINSTLEDTEV